MKVLVTGGTGFLGGWIVRGLKNAGHDVRVLHRAHSRLEEIKSVNFESALGDVTDPDSVDSACRGVDAVIHAAGLIGYKPELRDQMFKVNVGGTENVIAAVVKQKVQRLVFTSSVVAIGASPQPKVLNEDSLYEMGHLGLGYYDSKREAELKVLEAAKKGKINGVSLNPSVMFGPGDGLKDSRKLHLKVAQGKIPFYTSGGINVMNVEDAVQGHLNALTRGKSGERFILASENIYVKELFKWLAEEGGSRPPQILLPKIFIEALRLGRPVLNVLGIGPKLPLDSAFLATFFHWYDNAKAKSELAVTFRPARSAVHESMKWCKSHGLI
ncbi:MAG: SDR family NAD(P)-dependent oxidoreductase [Oligoflexia bacterium]|nr:SDR family NAD(P)-dependent oxidoreductase [Oligoflexia bacterium]